ncbi:MAG: lipoprotein [Firmicutes bacterium]|nr:lipoprotein [Bacillota bacterium]
MKKIVIALLLALVLSGCTTKDQQILNALDSEILVCDGTCVTDQTFGTYATNYYDDMIEAYLLSIAPNRYGEVVLLSNGETYEKTEIPRLDPVTNHFDIPIVQPYITLGLIISEIETYIELCTIDDVCVGPRTTLYSSITDVDYGFDEQSGFYTYHTISVKGEERIEAYRFNMATDDPEFEHLIYWNTLEKYHYSFLKDNIYKEYSYTANDDYSFVYIDIASKKYLYYDLNQEEAIFKMYNPENGIFYANSFSNNSVTYYKDMEFVASLRNDGISYLSSISLFSMNGWDAVLKNGSIETPYCTIYHEEVQVLNQYQVTMYTQGLRYYNLKAQLNLTEDEITDYVYPIEFEGDLTFDELYQIFIAFDEMENPLESVGLDQNDILAIMKELLEDFARKYK